MNRIRRARHSALPLGSAPHQFAVTTHSICCPPRSPQLHVLRGRLLATGAPLRPHLLRLRLPRTESRAVLRTSSRLLAPSLPLPMLGWLPITTSARSTRRRTLSGRALPCAWLSERPSQPLTSSARSFLSCPLRPRRALPRVDASRPPSAFRALLSRVLAKLGRHEGAEVC